MRRYDRTTVLIACTAGFFVTYFARMAISPVIPFISEDFAVSNAAIGLALSGMWLAYGIAQYPSGILGDRYGEKRIVLLAVGGTTVAAVFLAVAPIFAVFVVFAIALGGMAGVHYSPATALLDRTTDNIGRAVGIHLLGAPIAGLIAPVAAAWVGVRFGWRPAVATAILVGIPTYAFVVWGVPNLTPHRPNESIRARVRHGAGMGAMVRPAILFTLAIAMLGTFVVQGLLSFLPTFFIEYHMYTATIAGIGFSAFFVVRAVAQLILGTVSDRYGRDLAIGAALLFGSMGLFGLVFGSSIAVIAIAVGLAGIGMGFFAVIDPRFIDALGEGEQGSEFGLIRTVYVVFGSAGSVCVGLLADLFGWDISFLVLAVMLGVAGLAVFINRGFGLGY